MEHKSEKMDSPGWEWILGNYEVMGCDPPCRYGDERGEDFTLTLGGSSINWDQSFNDIGAEAGAIIVVGALEHKLRVEAEKEADEKAAAEAEAKALEERKRIEEDGSLDLLRAYLEDEYEQPLFDIKKGNGKWLRGQKIPPG